MTAWARATLHDRLGHVVILRRREKVVYLEYIIKMISRVELMDLLMGKRHFETFIFFANHLLSIFC